MDSSPLLRRLLEVRIAEALVDTPVVLVAGPRQAGKTTLVRQMATEGMRYLTLDDALTLLSARNDPVGMIRSLDRAVIDEIQRAPQLLLAIKKSVRGIRDVVPLLQILNARDTEYVLHQFGRTTGTARKAYVEFVQDQMHLGSQPELTGGGLVRSAGEWSEVVSMRKRGERQFSDERILGSGEFVEEVFGEAG